MKRLWFCLGLLLAFAACTTNAGRGSDQHDAASQAFTRTFEDFGCFCFVALGLVHLIYFT